MVQRENGRESQTDLLSSSLDRCDLYLQHLHHAPAERYELLVK
jgi:hypothetical protein